jgi:heptosyltransferase-2
VSAARAEKILVVGPSWVGDTIMAQVLYQHLVATAPRRPCIDVVAPSWSLPVLARMPEVRRAVELPAGHGELRMGLRWRIGRSLRSERYDRAIILPRSFKAALLPFFARIPIRTGFKAEARSALINDRRPLLPALDQTVKRYLALGVAADAPLPAQFASPLLRVEPENQALLVEKLGLADDRPVVAMMPGAEYGPAKRWPADQVVELAQRLLNAGNAVWVLGSARDREFTAPLENLGAMAGLHHLCGQTSLADAVDLLALARVAVTNDSGLMHMAAAVGTHVVAIYGSSSVGFTPPLTPRNDIVFRDIDCRPCFQRTCRFGHYRCLTEISVDQVERRVQRVLAARG